MKKTLRLIDDGTLDTVVRCSKCGTIERFSDVERNDDGDITENLSKRHECPTL